MATELERLRDPLAEFAPEQVDTAAIQGSTAGILHPYFGSEKRHDTGGVLATFREGIPASDYVVLVLGGSVAQAWATPGGRVFQKRVSGHPALAGRRVRILNYAHASHKQPQQVMRLAYLFSLGYRPDCVINIDGFNEVAFGCDNGSSGMNPVYPAYPSWGIIAHQFESISPEQWQRAARVTELRARLGELAGSALGRGLHRSSLLGSWALGRARGIDRERRALEQELVAGVAEAQLSETAMRQLGGPDYPPQFGDYLTLSVRNWFESSLSLDGLCRRRGIPYFHVLQPTLYDEGSKPLTEKERSFEPGTENWPRAVQQGYPRLRDRGQELQSLGILFVDGSQAFANANRELYYDPCHFLGPGSELLAEPIAGAFPVSYTHLTLPTIYSV